MEGGDLAAGGGSGGGAEEYSWVPVRVARLTYLLQHLSAMQQSRWLHRLGPERVWVERASASAAADDADADAERERQLKLARDLCHIVSSSWHGIWCVLHQVAQDMAEAVDELRPRPESAAWWQYWYTHDDVLPGCSHGFVHLTRGQVARARGLVTDAIARTQRVMEQEHELRQLQALAAGGAAAAAAAAYSTPALLARMRRAERLADEILLPMQELKRLLDHLIEVNSNNLRGRGGRERRRRRSAPPSRQTPAMEPMLRRSASI